MQESQSFEPLRTAPLRILVVDDEELVGLRCQRILSAEGHQVEAVQDGWVGLQAALTGQYDLILLDRTMPVDGLHFLRQLKAAGISTPVVMITEYPTVESAVEAMKEGAVDYLAKPFSAERLKKAVYETSVRSVGVREKHRIPLLEEPLEERECLLGTSPAMQRVLALVQRMAPTDSPLLLMGEKGTGKKTVAWIIHRLSPRREKPFLVCDCTTLALPLLESELFGQVKSVGSTLASSKQGLFEAAEGGTLLLDEVSAMPLLLQGKLLRVLETNRIQKLGETAEREIDVRVMVTSHHDLGEMVRKGMFREDLYARLNIASIHLPPLRERLEDIALLARTFLRQACVKMQVPMKSFTSEAMAHLESYFWPGNIRELKDLMERLALLGETDYIDVVHLPQEIRQASVRPSLFQLPKTWEEFRSFKSQVAQATLQDLERRFILEALQRAGGNVSRAAKQVGILRPNFYKLMRKYNIQPDELSSQ